MDLVIMSAGFGKRFGKGIKQLAKIGPNDETIMEMSVKDAKDAGFDRIIFVIREDIEDLFKQSVIRRVDGLGIDVQYVFQDMKDDIKGTVCAVLAAKDVIKSDFAVINADDYYGKNAFKEAIENAKSTPFMLGYTLANTLPDNGVVTRGVCHVDSKEVWTNNLILTDIEEIKGIGKDNMQGHTAGTIVSMNFWCFPNKYLEEMQKDYDGLKKLGFKGEFLLPQWVKGKVVNGTIVQVVPTNAKWVGITFEADVETAREKLANWR